MRDAHVDEMVAGYMRRLDAALLPLPRERRAQLREEVAEHVRAAREETPPRDPAQAKLLLERVGSPEEIAREAIEAERDPDLAQGGRAAPPDPAGAHGDPRDAQRSPRRGALLSLPALLVLAIVLAGGAIAIALGRSSMRPGASAPVAVPIEGGPPAGLAIDERRGVALVGEHDNARLDALDAARCGQLRLSACEAGARPVPGDTSLVGVGVDERTGSVYSLSAPYPERVADAYCGGRGPSSCMSWRERLRRLPQARATALQRRAERRAPALLARLGSEGGRIDVTSLDRCIGSGGGRACQPAQILLGGDPSALAVDEADQTVYVLDGLSGVVHVIDMHGCSESHRAGCAARPARVQLAQGSFRAPWRLYGQRSAQALAVDEANHTLYVGTDSGIAMIDTATCNGAAHSGCGAPPRLLADSGEPAGIAVDAQAHTVYVANRSGTVTVIDASTCNATAQRGCAGIATTAIVGFEPAGIAVDPAQSTVYVADEGSHSVSMIDAGVCDATVHSGCGELPKAVHLGNDPVLAAVDRRAHTLFVSNEEANAVDLLDTATCNVHTTSGCPGAAKVRIGEALQRTLSGLARRFAVMRHPNEGPALPAPYGFGRSAGAPQARYLGTAAGKRVWLVPGPYQVCIGTVTSGGCGSSSSVIAHGIGDTGSDGGGTRSRVVVAQLVPDGARSAYVTKRDGQRVSVPIHDGFISHAGRGLRSLTIVRAGRSSTIGLP